MHGVHYDTASKIVYPCYTFAIPLAFRLSPIAYRAADVALMLRRCYNFPSNLTYSLIVYWGPHKLREWVGRAEAHVAPMLLATFIAILLPNACVKCKVDRNWNWIMRVRAKIRYENATWRVVPRNQQSICRDKRAYTTLHISNRIHLTLDTWHLICPRTRQT